MANKIRFDHQAALEMLGQKGITMGMVANHFKVSRQAIYDLKRDQANKEKRETVTETRSAGSDGNRIIIRGKNFSISELLEAMPLKTYLPQLSDSQLNEIAYIILNKANRAAELEDQVKEIPNLKELIKQLRQEIDELRQISLKKKLISSGSQVIHGD